MPDAPVGASPVNANVDVIAGLREVAAFLEAHPELPRFNAYLLKSVYSDTARDVLSVVARALNGDAIEKASGREVQITTERFKPVTVEATALLSYLGCEDPPPPPTPRYEPIIARDGGES